MANKGSDAITSTIVYAPTLCQLCHVPITQERWDAAVAVRGLPACEICHPKIQEKLKIILPLWAKFKL